ncbi:MAG: DNA-binding protein [Bacilli bacterium]|nr:DNA-binding protein [Bacilli bacterium]
MKTEQIENRIHVSLLFSRYGDLLTENQRRIVSAYYLYDLSLSEIAEEEGISRAGVSEALKGAVGKMKEYEAKLGLLEKEEALKKKIEQAEGEKDPAQRLRAYERLGKEIKNGI